MKQKTARVRQIAMVFLTLLGGILVVLAIWADPLGLDVTPGVGVLQTVGFLFGIGCLTLAAYMYLYSLRPHNAPRSLQADIGVRLSATGFVFAVVTGLSDLFGIGTHVTPDFERPFIGPLQLGGIIIGLLTMLLGMFLYHTSRGVRTSSSMEFLVNGSDNGDSHPENAPSHE